MPEIQKQVEEFWERLAHKTEEDFRVLLRQVVEECCKLTDNKNPKDVIRRHFAWLEGE